MRSRENDDKLASSSFQVKPLERDKHGFSPPKKISYSHPTKKIGRINNKIEQETLGKGEKIHTFNLSKNFVQTVLTVGCIKTKFVHFVRGYSQVM